jgi:hypothetical protein
MVYISFHMYKPLHFLAALLISSTVFSQTSETAYLADTLIRAGAFKAAVTIYDFPKEIKELQQKALSYIKKDKERARTYLVRMVERGDKDISRNAAEYGLTQQEFDKMLAAFRTGHLPFYSDTSLITITKTNGLITFKTSGKLSLFNHLRIDTKASYIYYDDLRATKELKFYGKIWAQSLLGMEVHDSEKVKFVKKQSRITSFSLAVGTSKGYVKPALSLGYVIPSGELMNQPEFIIMTIL